MDTKTQQIIIIILGVLGVVSIFNGNQTVLDIIVAGLIGFLGQKTMNDKQSEMLEQSIKESGESDVQ